MLDGMFFEDNYNDFSSIANGSDGIHSKNQNLNCASYTNKPDPIRGDSNFVGLLNQGGTCYMNSSLQVLYMNPVLRQAIYDLPLCIEDNISKPSNFLEKNQKYDILIAIQKLFSKLQFLNIQSISTLNLTESFKWEGGEGAYQQDSQEFIRLFLFELLERILIGTPYDGCINSMFKILTCIKMRCRNCDNMRTREETNLDIVLPVKNIKSVEHSLKELFVTEEVIQDYKCENCQQKVDLVKSSKISHLPIFLNFPLNKFEFDLETFERIKINSKFEFPLELDMKDYLLAESSLNSSNDEKNLDKAAKEDTKYELYAIIIHRGTPYSGHYFAYIRDLNNEGNWNLEELAEFTKEPVFPAQQVLKTQEVVEIEPAAIKNNKAQNIENQHNKNSKKNQKQAAQNHNQKQNQNKAKKKKKAGDDNDEEHAKLNFDSCDHPIEYQNKNLAKHWFEFNDTSISPIQVGKLQKQFKSNESAYILFYMKKNISYSKPIPPQYLINYINQENLLLEKQRNDYLDLLNSLVISIYDAENFFIDEFNILSLRPDNLLDVNTKQVDLKLKFNHTLKDLLDLYYKKKNNGEPQFPENQFYSGFSLYEFSYDAKSNNLTLIQKYSQKDLANSLSELKICHNGRFVMLMEKVFLNVQNNLKTEILDRAIGAEFQPLEISLILLNKDYKFRTFSNLTLNELKESIKKYFNIDYNIDIGLKNNNKNIVLENISHDKKNNIFLNLKQLKINNKSILIVSKSKLENGLTSELNGTDMTELVNGNSVVQEISNKSESVKVSNIVCLEDDRDNPQIVRIKLNQSFEDLIKKIIKKFSIGQDNIIRLRKDIDGKIIHKNSYAKKIGSDPIFVEDSARVTVEFGEAYEESEIILKISLENNDEKLIKEFIVDPMKIKIQDLKNFVCKEYHFKESDYMIYKTNSFGDPCKAIKNENQTITHSGLKDNDLIYLKNVSAEINEIYLLNFYKPNNFETENEDFLPITWQNQDIKNPKSFAFYEIDNKNFLFNINISKEAKLSDLKREVIVNLRKVLNGKLEELDLSPDKSQSSENIKKSLCYRKNLEKMLGTLNCEDQKLINLVRLRQVNKKMDGEKILKIDAMPIKKLISENPSKLSVEILEKEESLKDNQIQLYVLTRNSEKKIYEKKINYVFNYGENNQLFSDYLYDNIRILLEKNNITIAKYSKYYYEWEIIPEFDEKGPINLKKSNFNLKDGDWISVKDDSLLFPNQKNDDFSTEEDLRLQKIMKASKAEITKTKANARKRDEKPLRILTEF